MSIELFQQGPEVYIPVLLISLLLTVIFYGVFPMIFALARRAPITKKRYRWTCYGVNAAVMVVFMILNGEPSNGAPYVLWTTVFASWGIKILNQRGVLTDGEDLIKDENLIVECKSCGYRSKEYFELCPVCSKGAKQYIYPQAPEQSAPAAAPRFCRHCGEKLLEGSAFCRKCGTAVIKE